MYALDTNTVVYFFQGKGRVSRNLLATPPNRTALPSVVLYELEMGAIRSAASRRRRQQLAELVDAVSVLPFGAEEARTAARIRASLERSGHPIGPLDTLIAATALSHGAILVTHNTKEFRRVSGLRCEDWY